MRNILYFVFLVVLTSSVIYFRAQHLQIVTQAIAQSAPEANSCNKVGNNLATMFAGSNPSYTEAQFTLALYSGNEKTSDIAAIINNSPNTVIVRLGISTDNIGPPADVYIQFLNDLLAQTTKPFIATAGHNEPNCAENVPLDKELAYMRAVTSAISDPRLTFITGQFDFYCGDSGLLEGSDYEAESVFRDAYLRAMLTDPQIHVSGVAFPYYITPGTYTGQYTYDYTMKYIQMVHAINPSLDIYITESGPFLESEDSLYEFIKAVSLLVAEPSVKGILLFNALGLNKSPAFNFTAPFWNPACREALRTICTDVEATYKICSTGLPPEYYLYPIEGLNTGDQSTIYSSLAQQGYEVQCTTPTTEVKAVEGGNLQAFLDSLPSDQAVFSFPDVNLKHDYKSVKVPLFRNATSNVSSLDSIENYFGFLDSNTDGTTDNTVNTGVAYALLGTQQQCQQQVSLLNTIKSMCSKLDDPEYCGLYQPIPDTQYTTKSLQAEWENVSKKNFSCSEIAAGWQENYSTDYSLSEANFKELNKALQNTPLYLSGAYRLAFLVLATEQVPNDTFGGLFEFLSRDNLSSDTRYDIKVIAFRVPDVGTNKDSESVEDGGFMYRDPLQLTRDVLLQTDVGLAQQVEEAARRAELVSAPDIGSGDEQLKCADQKACQDPLVKSLVQMIGKSGKTCEISKDELKYENATDIQSSGDLKSSPSRTFVPNFDLIKNLLKKPGETTSKPQEAEFEFMSTVTVTRQNGASGQSKVKAYLIYPYGAELQSIEDTLIGHYLGVDQIEALAASPPPALTNYFKLQNVETSMSDAEQVRRYLDPAKLAAGCIQTTPTAPFVNAGSCYSEYRLALKNEATDAEPRILGGRLSYIIRGIQSSIGQVDKQFNTYVRSCRTLEDYLLQRCDGKPSDEKDKSDKSDYLSTEVVDTSNCQNLPRIDGGPRNIPYSDIMCTTGHSNGLPAFEYTDLYSIPNWNNSSDPVRGSSDVSEICNDALYTFVACTNGSGLTQDGKTRQGVAPSLIAHRVDENGNFTPDGSQTACEYVVRKAQESGGVSPRLALAMWGEESGFSAFTTDDSGEDFGVISVGSSRSTNSLASQVDTFIATVMNRSNYLELLLKYSGEVDKSETPPVLFCNNRDFPARLQAFYTYLGTD